MSTEKKDKWIKYFQGKGDVDTFVRATGSVKNKSYLYDLEGKKTSTKLEHGEPILVKEREEYIIQGPFAHKLFIESSKGNGWLHVDNIDKGIGQRASIRLESNKLIGLGERMIVPMLNGEENVSCRIFKTAEKLAISILHGLENEPSVPDYIVDQVSQLFYDDVVYTQNSLISGNVDFKWNGSVSEIEKNSMGVYLGELLIGYMALVGKTECFSEPDIVKFPIEYFGVPENPAFSGIDSFIQYQDRGKNQDGGKFLISSKAGNKGASPSIWKNIMPYLKPNKLDSNTNATLEKLYNICKNIDGGKITGRKGMQYVYRYGVKEILNYEVGPTTRDGSGKEKAVVNPQDFYNVLKAGKPYPPVYDNIILDAIKIQKSLNSTEFKSASSTAVTTALEKGVGMSSFFCRYISDKLNNEINSLDKMRNTVSGRVVYQAYLNTPKFKKGKIYFTTKKATKASLITTGSKSGATKIDMSNTVNYNLIFEN